MKVGILTFHNSVNFGAILQEFALQRVLSKNAVESETIIYSGISKASLYRKFLHNIRRSIFSDIRRKRTDKFKHDFIPVSDRVYTSSFDLHAYPPEYDAYITGSDQVWNPYITGFDESYFLSFAPVERRKMSYAASFGVGTIPASYKQRVAYLLNRLDSISVREQSAQELVLDMINRKPALTLDPTLLLDCSEWSEIEKSSDSGEYNIENDGYVLCYYMPGDHQACAEIAMIANTIAAEEKLKVISIGQKEYHVLNPFEHNIFDAGPLEFLSLVKHASYVVTNSFHGTVFAIIFNKDFWSVCNENANVSANRTTRIKGLLNILGLQIRLISVGDTGFAADCLYEPVDYSRANLALMNFKKLSIDFLYNSFV